MANKAKSIRASQLISPFGAGAVVELGGESFTCMDTSRWPKGACMPLAPNNLEKILHKQIRRPPTEDSGGASVPFSRFPRWLFCPTCRRLTNYKHAHDQAREFETPTCSERACRHTALVPMRFVAVCEEGHLEDVDWYWWAHLQAQKAETGQCTRQTAELYFKTTGASGGDFDSMTIECSCTAKNSFEGLTDRPYPLGCSGKQPWQSRNTAADCQSQPRVHPRGASNIYYPAQLSALDLASDVVAVSMNLEASLKTWLELHPLALSLKAAVQMLPDLLNNPFFYRPVVDEGCRQFGLAEELVAPIVTSFLKGTDSDQDLQIGTNEDQTQHGILVGEWPVLARNVTIRTKHLQTKPIRLDNIWPNSFNSIWEQVTLISRLREVRALLGFRRLKPDKLVPVDLSGDSDWLPGVELFGEGIFLKFNERTIRAWEDIATASVVKRLASLCKKCERWGKEPASVYSSARFIALHTFAHGLVRRLAFDAGYSASSLRERIYCGIGTAPMAGILIYTSDGDSEGSLGGLVRQGEPERLLGTIERTIADLSWCSGDPVCSEMENQGVDAMNAAACHACSLVSETSCMYNNSLLDRRLLIGSQQAGIPGLLCDLVRSAV